MPVSICTGKFSMIQARCFFEFFGVNGRINLPSLSIHQFALSRKNVHAVALDRR